MFVVKQTLQAIFNAALPDLYMGGAKEFSSNFIWKQETMLTESVSRVILSSHTTMFAALSNSYKLAKFTLPSLKEKVIIYAYYALIIAVPCSCEC